MSKSKVEETPRFSNAFIGRVAVAGRKVQGSSRPELIATSTKDKFSLNAKACQMLGVAEGSKVVMIDQNLPYKDADGNVVRNVFPQDKRFYIAVAPENYTGVTATISKQKAFSYSGIWSAILMNDPEICEASVADLVRAKLGILRGEDNKNYVGVKKVHMALTQYTETLEDGATAEYFPLSNEMAEAGEGVKIYSLSSFEFREHTPKEVGEEDSDVDVDGTEDVDANE